MIVCLYYLPILAKISIDVNAELRLFALQAFVGEGPQSQGDTAFLRTTAYVEEASGGKNAISIGLSSVETRVFPIARVFLYAYVYRRKAVSPWDCCITLMKACNAKPRRLRYQAMLCGGKRFFKHYNVLIWISRGNGMGG